MLFSGKVWNVTNTEYLLTLSPDQFNKNIISVINKFGGNTELISRFLLAQYVPDLTVRDILTENYSGAVISWRVNNTIYSAVSTEDFSKRYGTVAEFMLGYRVSDIRVGKNGCKTIVIKP